MNRHIISSGEYNQLKQGTANQLEGHLSAGLSGPKGREKFFEEFQVS